MSNKLVSIIIPVYNSAEFLSKCLDSVLAQTHKEIEVIIVDDGSKDNSGAICDEYQQRDSRVKVYHRENQGASLARKFGCSVMKGEYVQFVDSDDWIKPNMTEKLLAVAEENHSDMVWCNTEMVDKDATTVHQINFNADASTMLKNLYWGQVPGWLPNKLMKASLFDDVIFPKDMMMEDVYISTQLLLKNVKSSFVTDPLYSYNRLNENAATKGNNGDAVLMRAMPNIENCYQCLAQHKVLEQYEEAFSCLAMRLKIALLKTKGIAEAKSVYKFAQKHLKSYGLQPPVAYIYWIGFNWGKFGEALLSLYLKK